MDWLLVYELVGGLSLVGMVLSWSAFLVLSVWRIEKKIMAEGKPRPCAADGIGARAIWYAWAVTLPAKSFSQLENWMLDTHEVKRHMEMRDVVLGWMLMVTGHTWLAIVILSFFIDIG